MAETGSQWRGVDLIVPETHRMASFNLVFHFLYVRTLKPYGAQSARAGGEGTPASRPRTRARDALSRRVLDHDRTQTTPTTPAMGDFIRRSSGSIHSQHEDSFMLSSPRGSASAYLNKLGVVSRCLNQAMDAARDVP
ncbi:uncharacterized protein [Choristoneura fumiferana]|uniref:uncharacterized protein n=1 Tax=Choristoneura fumiferana TaxID=7141 RepID=UPI003D157AC2